MEIIEEIKKYEKGYDTSVFYVSDHGESLGENGIYLHGLPYFMAPKEQIKVPAFIWLSKKNKLEQIKEEYSHDNIFHTLLEFYNIETKELVKQPPP